MNPDLYDQIFAICPILSIHFDEEGEALLEFQGQTTPEQRDAGRKILEEWRPGIKSVMKEKGKGP